jgi:D-alanine transfer protein
VPREAAVREAHDASGGYRHLHAAAWALVLVALVVLAGLRVADSLEQRAVYALAPKILADKHLGRALQADAFGRPDLLVMYGSSELMNVESPFHASNLFQQHPRGFEPFIVGRDGTTPLNMLQQIASVGPALRGKRVVLSYTPGMFFRELINPDFYAGSFSPLHAYGLAFSLDLDRDLKRSAALQMLKYPDQPQDDPLLRFAMERLAGDSPLDRALYDLVLPVGLAKQQMLRLQDRLSTLGLIWRQSAAEQPLLPRPQPAPIDWPALQAEADQAAHDAVTNNPFGMPDEDWARDASTLIKARWNDGSFLEQLDLANAWTDLDLTLRVLRHYDARVLILVMPMHGFYYDYMGVTPEARQQYYRRLEAVGQANGVPVLGFPERDTDRYFLTDPSGHLSPKGWVAYAEALDAFFHQAR